MAGYLLMGAAVFLIVRMLVQEQESRAAQENIDSRDRKAATGIVGLVRMLASQYVVPFVRGRPFWDKQRLEWRRRLISAGLREVFTPDEFIALRLLNIVLFPVVSWVMNVFGLVDVSLTIVLIMSVVGYFFPALWVDSKRKARQKEVLKAMPFVIDLLALATEAGADFMGAIGKVVDKAKPSPLVDELGQMLRENRLGASQKESIREMAARIDLTEFSSFAAILISSQEMGASIGRILRQQSEQIRIDRIMRAEKAGAAASQMVLVPVVLFVLPSVVLMMGGPFILGFLNGGGL
jgi:tight adherence protein C